MVQVTLNNTRRYIKNLLSFIHGAPPNQSGVDPVLVTAGGKNSELASASELTAKTKTEKVNIMQI